MTSKLVLVVLAAIFVTGCGVGTLEPTISFNADACSSSNPASWPPSPLNIEVSNNTDTRTAIVLGAYRNGFEHEDLVAYGSDISTRPDFITAIEIHESSPNSTSTLVFDPGPGTYFMVCLPDSNTMVVLDDITIDN